METRCFRTMLGKPMVHEFRCDAHGSWVRRTSPQSPWIVCSKADLDRVASSCAFEEVQPAPRIVLQGRIGGWQ